MDDAHAAAAPVARFGKEPAQHRFRLAQVGVVEVKLIAHRIVAPGQAPEHARADGVAAVAHAVAGLQRA